MKTRTLVIGSGDCAARVTEMLVFGGARVVVAAAGEDVSKALINLGAVSGSESVELLAPARLDSCRGFVGKFEVQITVKRQPIRHQVASIVIAEDAPRHANFKRYGLRPSPRVRSLSDVTKALEEKRDQLFADSKGRTVLFLDGLAGEGAPFIFAEILRNAIAIQALPGACTAVLTTNLKVAADGLEALYRKAKEAGTLFFRLTDSLPTLRQLEDGSAVVTFEDETTGYAYSLTPGITVVDERCLPSETMKHLGNKLGLHADGQGFLQADNVHRTNVLTNRRGILVCGLSRRPMGPAEFPLDAAEAVNAVFNDHCFQQQSAAAAAFIDTGQCIRCLTCHRLCPHRSIQKGARMEVNADACEGCGICAAECPRRAIALGQGAGRQASPADMKVPAGALVAFCCTRSAARAKQLAEHNGLALPQHLKIVEVPCAGALSTRHILDALTADAGGVLVLTCHAGNCHSETGYAHARRRVALLSEQLQSLGTLAERIEIRSLAANMAAEFVEIVHQFTQKLQTMTPQRSN
jgi:coenzyme F420-reducing hydrogenase delta subunit/Pyruvate/2-oxoacid:ferredoxin oxidoreductase delta subunit